MQDGGVAGEVLASDVRARLIDSVGRVDPDCEARADRALVILRERTGAFEVIRPVAVDHFGFSASGGRVDARAARALSTLRSRLDRMPVEDPGGPPMWDDQAESVALPSIPRPEPELPSEPEGEPEKNPEWGPDPETPGPELPPAAAAFVPSPGRVVLDVDPQEFAEVLGSALARALSEVQFAVPPQQVALPPVIYRAPETARRSFWADTWHADVLLSVIAMVIVAAVLVAFAT